MAPQDRPGRTLRYVMYVVPVVVVACVFVGVEGVSAILNRRAGESVWPVLFDLSELTRARGTIRQEGRTQTLSMLDPHLGYEREYAVLEKIGDAFLPGFAIYGDPSDSSARRIVALGGSTTDPTDPNNWPKQLHVVLEQQDVHNVIFNGGVSGFSSNQDLLKLIRDALPLRPAVIVTLEGVNDAGFVHSVPEHPMVHPYQERVLMELRGDRAPVLLPNTVRAWERWRRAHTPGQNRVSGVNYGPKSAGTDVEQWRRNVKLMRACAAAEGIEFTAFLQPVLGVGTYTPTAREAGLLDEARKLFGGTYLDKLEAFYAGARAACAEDRVAIDLCDAFAGKTDLYRDARHPNAEGYAIIANAIAEFLRAKPR